MAPLKAVTTTSPTRDAADKPLVEQGDLGGPRLTELAPTLKRKHNSHQTATGSCGRKLGGDDGTQGVVTSDTDTQLFDWYSAILQSPKREKTPTMTRQTMRM